MNTMTEAPSPSAHDSGPPEFEQTTLAEVAALRKQIERITATRKTGWLSTLETRKLKELEFHNDHRTPGAQADQPKDVYEQLYGNKKYYATTALSGEYFESWIRNRCKDKIVLDYACGNGNNTRRAARAGATLAIGLDISDVSVRNAQRAAAEEGLEQNIVFVQGDCEATGLPFSSVDVVICVGMLHHLDLSFALPEIRRILKPGGICFGLEALDYNPAIKLYRHLTPQMRTEWERAHILSYRDLRFMERFFDIRNVRHWHLLSIAGVKVPRLLPIFNWLDQRLLRLPGLKLMSWMFSFEMHKRVE